MAALITLSLVLSIELLCHIGMIGATNEVKCNLSTSEDWVLLARVTFPSTSGNSKVNFHSKYPRTYMPQNILLYYDESSSWPAVSAPGLNATCFEKESSTYLKPENNQIIVLTPEHYWSGCENVPNEEFVECNTSRSFRSSMDRVWYIVVSRCRNSTETLKGIALDYRIEVTNGTISNSLSTCTQEQDPTSNGVGGLGAGDVVTAAVVVWLCVAFVKVVQDGTYSI